MEKFNLFLTILFASTLAFKYIVIKIKFGINPLLIGRNKKTTFVKILETTPIILTTLVILLVLKRFFFEQEDALQSTMLNLHLILTYIGVFLGLFSFYFLILGYYNMGTSWRIGVSNQFRTPLITTGIFELTRNPVYIFFNLFSLSIFLTTGEILFLILFLLIAVNLHLLILQEEKSLEKIHGEEYLKYKSKVPRYM